LTASFFKKSQQGYNNPKQVPVFFLQQYTIPTQGNNHHRPVSYRFFWAGFNKTGYKWKSDGEALYQQHLQWQNLNP
jgi:hypothetical protein